MANPQHLEILNEGVSTWNQWRAENLPIFPDLSGAFLPKAELQEINLREANLSDANFTGADLSEADLSDACLFSAGFFDAKLFKTNLSNSDIRNANLLMSNLSWANLSSANLCDADLRFAVLRESSVRSANFRNINMGLTTFADIDLSEVIGLDTVVHHSQSSIGLDTFFASKGKIPEAFLRGAGVPDIFLEYASSFVGKSIEFYSAFISYSSKDEDFAKRLYADLQAKGVRCWFAPEDLKIGDKFRIKIDEAIRFHDKLLLILSSNSIQSGWVEKEVESAFERERRDKRIILFPIRLDDAVMDVKDGWAADIRRTRHIGDFKEWKNHDSYQKTFDRLLHGLKSNKPKD